jgi:hypothetical protein
MVSSSQPSLGSLLSARRWPGPLLSQQTERLQRHDLRIALRLFRLEDVANFELEVEQYLLSVCRTAGCRRDVGGRGEDGG